MIAALLTVADFSFPTATVLAWLGVAVAIVGLLQGRGLLFPVALAGLGVLALVEILRGELTGSFSPVIGAALLASAEFGYWSFEFEAGVRHSRPSILRRIGVILGLVLVGAALSGILATLGGL